MAVHGGDARQGAYNLAKRKVVCTLKQFDHEYHDLHIMIGPMVPAFLEEKLVVDDVEEAIQHVAKWMRRAWTTEPRWKQRKGTNAKPQGEN